MPQLPPSPQSGFLATAMQGQGGGIPPQQPPMPGGQPPPPQGLPPQMMAMLKQAATMGRGGDTTLAHLTPGEKTVPPEVQTPKVLATLNKAYKDKGVSPEQFTVGSPQSSVNPATGLNEYNFMSAFLPIAMGLAGSFLLPGVGTALGASAGAGAGAAAGAATTGLSDLALSSIGSGLGTTAGGLLTGQKPLQAGLSGALGGLGGYALGNMSTGLTAMGNVPESAAKAAAPAAANGGMSAGPAFTNSDMARMTDMFAGNNPATAAATAPQGWAGNSMSMLGQKFNPYQVAGGAGGSQIGSYLGSPGKPYVAPKPAGFDDKMKQPGDLPPWNQQLGQTTYNGPQANFSGYNPATNYPAAWRFY